MNNVCTRTDFSHGYGRCVQNSGTQTEEWSEVPFIASTPISNSGIWEQDDDGAKYDALALNVALVF